LAVYAYRGSSWLPCQLIEGTLDTTIPIECLIRLLEEKIPAPTMGLPEPVFLFFSRLTPMINVDLFIKDKMGRTLLTWRDDGHDPAGWHIPGGIIRYKERAEARIHAVALSELGATVKFDPSPMNIEEVIHQSRAVRGHFISMLYRCYLTSPLDEALGFQGGTPQAGQWAWHEEAPPNLISVHDMYRAFLCKELLAPEAGG